MGGSVALLRTAKTTRKSAALVLTSAIVLAASGSQAAPAGAATFAKTDYPITPKAGQTSMIAESLAVADLNKDARPDIAVLDALPQGNLVSVFLNHGDGTFAGAVQHA